MRRLSKGKMKAVGGGPGPRPPPWLAGGFKLVLYHAGGEAALPPHMRRLSRGKMKAAGPHLRPGHDFCQAVFSNWLMYRSA